MSVGVDVRGLAAVQRLMDKLEPADLKKLLQKSSSAGAKALKPHVQAETPVRTGKLRKSISVGQARKDRPAAIAKFRPKVAFYRAMVIGGTKAHRIRFPDQKRAGVPKEQGNIRHPGHKDNDIMGRAWKRGESDSMDAVNKTIHDYLEAL